MGKKRRNHESKKSVIHEDESDDDSNGFSTASLTAILIALIAIAVRTGSLSSIPKIVRSATLSSLLIPFRLGQSIMSTAPSAKANDVYKNVSPQYVEVDGRKVKDYSSHPLVFAALREAIIREGGYVHPDLGLMVPAPSGATRGVGMIRDSYNKCQTRCTPGTVAEKRIVEEQGAADFPSLWNAPSDNWKTIDQIDEIYNLQQSIDEQYRQEEILIQVPLSYQMTRDLALKTLEKLIPEKVLIQVPIKELDDAALLVLLLAHEKGKGLDSKFHPYIASLPVIPSCGYSPEMKSKALETIEVMAFELGLDVNAWPGELVKATERANMIAEGLNKDYGKYIKVSDGETSLEVIQWALCQVASRATAGSEQFGLLRLVPMADMVNHDVNAGGFSEPFNRGGTQDAGKIVVRSIRHGRRRPLKKGQEVLVNYNVPDYSPLDWFVSLGFVPQEAMKKWKKVEPHFKKTRTFATN